MTQVARPVSDVSNTNWTPSPVYVQIGGVNPNDSSPVSTNIPPGGTFVVQLSQLAAPVTGVHTLTVRLRKTDDSDLTATFALLQSGTTIASMTVSPTTTFTNFELELTDQEIDLITDYKNLQVTVIVNAGSGSGSTSGSIPGSQIASGGSIPGSAIASGSGPESLTSASGLPVGSGMVSGSQPGSFSSLISGSVSGSGQSGVITDCCPNIGIPETLYLSFSDATGSCGCLADAGTITLTYDSGTGTWSGGTDVCGASNRFIFQCTSGLFNLQPYFTDTCEFAAFVGTNPCSLPFSCVIAGVNFGGCCSGTITVTVRQ